MNIKSYNTLLKLFQEFYRSKNVTGTEFIEAKLLVDTLDLTENEIEKFVLVITHKNFLDAVKTNVVEHYKFKNYNDVRIIMVIFLMIFASDMEVQNLFEIFKELKCAFKSKILLYFCHESNLIQTALTGCKFFEDEYVLNQIINPLLCKTELFKKVDELLFREKMKKRASKPPTVPDLISVLHTTKRVPIVPLNTPVEMVFKARDIPRSLYRPASVERKLIGEYEKNRLKAQKLLAQAKALEKNFCRPKKEIVCEEIFPPRFKAKKAPRSKKPVEIKANVATVLRDASLCIKEQEKEVKKIEAIINGGGTLDKYKELEESVRELEEKKSLEDIERKHLEGLLTFEEAILAKRKLMECNRERFKQFMEERDAFLQQLEEWKEEEQKKIKELVKKSQLIERNAKESEKKLKHERLNQANQFKDEKRKILAEAYEKKQEELAKKMKLIEEIKTLHQLKSLHPVKEFDPSECPNFGLLCQMSIAELQKKLTEVKQKMEQQLEQKRKCIRHHKEKQRQMIENVKNFITQTRMSKPKRTALPIRPAKLARSPDLDKLRCQLDNARMLRKNNAKLDGIPCKP